MSDATTIEDPLSSLDGEVIEMESSLSAVSSDLGSFCTVSSSFSSLAKSASSAIGNIRNALEAKMKEITVVMSDALKTAKAFVSSMKELGASIANFISSKINAALDIITEIVKMTKAYIANLAKSALASLKAAFSSAVASVKSTLSSMANSIKLSLDGLTLSKCDNLKTIGDVLPANLAGAESAIEAAKSAGKDSATALADSLSKSVGMTAASSFANINVAAMFPALPSADSLQSQAEEYAQSPAVLAQATAIISSTSSASA